VANIYSLRTIVWRFTIGLAVLGGAGMLPRTASQPFHCGGLPGGILGARFARKDRRALLQGRMRAHKLIGTPSA